MRCLLNSGHPWDASPVDEWKPRSLILRGDGGEGGDGGGNTGGGDFVGDTGLGDVGWSGDAGQAFADAMASAAFADAATSGAFSGDNTGSFVGDTSAGGGSWGGSNAGVAYGDAGVGAGGFGTGNFGGFDTSGGGYYGDTGSNFTGDMGGGGGWGTSGFGDYGTAGGGYYGGGGNYGDYSGGGYYGGGFDTYSGAPYADMGFNAGYQFDSIAGGPYGDPYSDLSAPYANENANPWSDIIAGRDLAPQLVAANPWEDALQQAERGFNIAPPSRDVSPDIPPEYLPSTPYSPPAVEAPSRGAPVATPEAPSRSTMEAPQSYRGPTTAEDPLYSQDPYADVPLEPTTPEPPAPPAVAAPSPDEPAAPTGGPQATPTGQPGDVQSPAGPGASIGAGTRGGGAGTYPGGGQYPGGTFFAPSTGTDIPFADLGPSPGGAYPGFAGSGPDYSGPFAGPDVVGNRGNLSLPSFFTDTGQQGQQSFEAPSRGPSQALSPGNIPSRGGPSQQGLISGLQGPAIQLGPSGQRGGSTLADLLSGLGNLLGPSQAQAATPTYPGGPAETDIPPTPDIPFPFTRGRSRDQRDRQGRQGRAGRTGRAGQRGPRGQGRSQESFASRSTQAASRAEAEANARSERGPADGLANYGPQDRSNKNIPASLRYNNPGAAWPNSFSGRFGMTDRNNRLDSAGNQIGGYPTQVHGLANNIALALQNYVGKTVSQAMSRWSGGHRAEVGPNSPFKGSDIVTRDMVLSPAFWHAMVGAESGRGGRLSEAQIAEAIAMVKAGSAAEYEAQNPNAPATLSAQQFRNEAFTAQQLAQQELGAQGRAGERGPPAVAEVPVGINPLPPALPALPPAEFLTPGMTNFAGREAAPQHEGTQADYGQNYGAPLAETGPYQTTESEYGHNYGAGPPAVGALTPGWTSLSVATPPQANFPAVPVFEGREADYGRDYGTPAAVVGPYNMAIDPGGLQGQIGRAGFPSTVADPGGLQGQIGREGYPSTAFDPGGLQDQAGRAGYPNPVETPAAAVVAQTLQDVGAPPGVQQSVSTAVEVAQDQNLTIAETWQVAHDAARDAGATEAQAQTAAQVAAEVAAERGAPETVEARDAREAQQAYQTWSIPFSMSPYASKGGPGIVENDEIIGPPMSLAAPYPGLENVGPPMSLAAPSPGPDEYAGPFAGPDVIGERGAPQEIAGPAPGWTGLSLAGVPQAEFGRGPSQAEIQAATRGVDYKGVFDNIISNIPAAQRGDFGKALNNLSDRDKADVLAKGPQSLVDMIARDTGRSKDQITSWINNQYSMFGYPGYPGGIQALGRDMQAARDAAVTYGGKTGFVAPSVDIADTRGVTGWPDEATPVGINPPAAPDVPIEETPPATPDIPPSVPQATPEATPPSVTSPTSPDTTPASPAQTVQTVAAQHGLDPDTFAQVARDTGYGSAFELAIALLAFDEEQRRRYAQMTGIPYAFAEGGRAQVTKPKKRGEEQRFETMLNDAFESGALRFNPEGWQHFIEHAPESEHVEDRRYFDPTIDRIPYADGGAVDNGESMGGFPAEAEDEGESEIDARNKYLWRQLMPPAGWTFSGRVIQPPSGNEVRRRFSPRGNAIIYEDDAEPGIYQDGGSVGW